MHLHIRVTYWCGLEAKEGDTKLTHIGSGVYCLCVYCACVCAFVYVCLSFSIVIVAIHWLTMIVQLKRS